MTIAVIAFSRKDPADIASQAEGTFVCGPLDADLGRCRQASEGRRQPKLAVVEDHKAPRFVYIALLRRRKRESALGR
jgi:hypothetical protein